MSKDYYKILNLSKSASADEVKRSFRELAHKHHPDKGGDAEKFKELNEAYQVLGNAEKRKQYDQYGTTFDPSTGSGFGAGGPFGGFGSPRWSSGEAGGFNGGGINIDMDDLGDMFGDFFGSASRRRTQRKSRGADIEMNLNLSFKDSIFGGEKIIELYKNSKCDACGGMGAEPGAKINTCTECGGAGKIKRTQNTVFGTFQTSSLCSRCGGEGKTPERFCKQCSGTGIRKKSVSLKINIPAGVEDGEILRVGGSGESAGRGGVAGDLFLHINVSQDKRFTREGDNIATRAALDFKIAALGGYINVETLDGEMRIKIPEGTESGQVFRLRGKGVANRGDMLVEVYITVPKKLTKKQKKMLEEWEE